MKYIAHSNSRTRVVARRNIIVSLLAACVGATPSLFERRPMSRHAELRVVRRMRTAARYEPAYCVLRRSLRMRGLRGDVIAGLLGRGSFAVRCFASVNETLVLPSSILCVERHRQNACDMQRFSLRTVRDLMTAARPVRHDERVRRRTHGR